jgi:hypothetical protein
MPVIIQNAEITTQHDGVTPGIYCYDNGAELVASLYLDPNTKACFTDRNHDECRNRKEDAAITIDAKVWMLRTYDDDTPLPDLLFNWEFHLIQFFREVKFKADFAGQTQAEGSMTMDFASLPALPDGWLLDANEKLPEHGDEGPGGTWFPWAEQVQAGDYSVLVGNSGANWWHVEKLQLYDHPNTQVPLREYNVVTTKWNYLYSIYRQFRIITVLVVYIPDFRVFRPVGHIEWKASWDSTIHWNPASGRDLTWDPARTTSSFVASDRMVKGLPDEPGIKDIWNRVADTREWRNQTYNVLIKRAFTAVRVAPQNTENKYATNSFTNAKLARQVPPNHFR